MKLAKALEEYGVTYNPKTLGPLLTAYAEIKGKRRKIGFQSTYPGKEFVLTTTAFTTEERVSRKQVPPEAMSTMIEQARNELRGIEGEIDEVIAMYSTDVAEIVFGGKTTGKMRILRELARRKIIELGNMFLRPHLHIVCDYIQVDLEEYEFLIELELDGTGVTVTVNGFPTERETVDYQTFVQMLKHLDTIKAKLEEVKNEFTQLGK